VGVRRVADHDAANLQRTSRREVFAVAREYDPNAPIVDPTTGDVIEWPLNDD